jgi:phosphate transport system substrate-binding protein
MSYASMQNQAGQWVQPNDASFAAAAASADWKNAKDFFLVMTDAPGEASWPIAATNFILVYKQPKNSAGTKAALDFFKWAYENGGKQAEELDYVPLPKALTEQIEAYWQVEVKL